MTEEENKALEILKDEMSYRTITHIEEIPHLKHWIVEAMIRYAESVNPPSTSVDKQREERI